jgi:hypothetical protein
VSVTTAVRGLVHAHPPRLQDSGFLSEVVPKPSADEAEHRLHPNRKADPKKKRPKASRDDVDLLLHLSWEQGCDIVKAGNGHFKVYTPDGGVMIPIPATPSGYRTVRNKRAQLKRAGIDLTVKKKR